jgi:AmiR/NasT family two-component response regulator
MRRLKILVADDESIIRLGLRTMLTALGHEVLLAANGRDALELVRNARPDLALLDLQMPLTDGLETAKAIARKTPMPIIVLTAYSSADLLEKAAQLPIQGYLVKPVSERDLAAAIEVAMARFDDSQAAARQIAELRDDLETRKVVDRAKGALMKTGMAEDEAFLTIQHRARENRINLRQAAEAIISESAKKTGP